jgi:hypothetical protein
MSYIFKEKMGIPNPNLTWGGGDIFSLVAEATPEAWSEERPGRYYIDNTHVLATDTDNLYGYPDKPRLTIPKNPWVYQPGEVVEVHGGGYTAQQGSIQIKAAGLPLNPVFIKGYGLPTLLTELIPQGEYIVIEGFDLSDIKGKIGCRRVSDEMLHHCIMRNHYCDGKQHETGGANAALISFGNVGGVDNENRAHNLIAYDNVLHSVGSLAPDGPEEDILAFSVNQECDYVWVLGNESYKMGGDSIRIGKATLGDDTLRCSHIFVQGNHFYNNKENAVDVKEADNVLIVGNNFHDFSGSASSSGSSIVIHNKSKNILVAFNRLHACSKGVAITNVDNALVFGNLIYNCRRHSEEDTESGYLTSGGVGIACWSDSAADVQNIKIFNNTIYSCERMLTIPEGVGNRVINNLMVNRTNPDGFDVYVGSTAIAGSVFNNNISWHTNGSVSRFFDGNIKDDLDTFDNAESNLIVDPLLSIEAGAKFGTIQDTSPAVDIGYDITGELTEFFSILGTETLSSDLYGYERLQGGAYDIGCHETGGVFIPSIPLAPTDVLVDAGNSRLVWSLNSLNETNIVVKEEGVELATLPSGTYEVSVPGISSGVKTYSVEVSNSEGSSSSPVITSMVLSTGVHLDGSILTIADRASHYNVQTSVKKEGNLKFTKPIYSDGGFGTKSSWLKFSTGESGFNYVAGKLATITGKVSGTGICEIVPVLTSGEGVAKGRVRVGDSFIDMECPEYFIKAFRVLAEIDGTVPYTINAITDGLRHYSGLSALSEIEEVIDPVVWNTNTIEFINPDGEDGTWNFDDGTTSNELNPTHVFWMDGEFLVTFTNAETNLVTKVPVLVTVDAVPLVSISTVISTVNTSILEFTASGAYSYEWSLNGVKQSEVSPTFIVDFDLAEGFESYTVSVIGTTERGVSGFKEVSGIAYAPNILPTGTFTVARNKLEVTFTPAFDDEDGVNSNLKYLWHYGNGVTSTEAKHTYAYPNEVPGGESTYDVYLEVTDERGGVTTTPTKSVIVRDIEVLGPNLIPNGDFEIDGDNGSFVAGSATMTVENGIATLTGNYGSQSGISLALSGMNLEATYLFEVRARAVTSDAQIKNLVGFVDAPYVTFKVADGMTTYTKRTGVTSTNLDLRVYTLAAGNVMEIEYISLREVL